MTRAFALLIDDKEQRVAVAVIERFSYPLHLAAGVSFAPDLLATPAPEHRSTLLHREAQRFGVHVRQHQDLARVMGLHDGWHQAVGIKRYF